MSGTKQLADNLTSRLFKDYTYSIWWNLLLITAGSAIVAIGVKSLAVPHEFVPGGVFGLAALTYYVTGFLNPGQLFFLFSVPLFIFAWVKVSRRFFYYSAYATIANTLFYEVLSIDIVVHNHLYACVASGVLVGFGSGIVLRSLGSNGGLDVLAVYMFQRFNIGVGKFYFVFNVILYSLSLTRLPADLVIASMIMMFITGLVLENTLALFSQRKVVFIISDAAEEICHDILTSMKQSATFLKGFGAYTRKEKNVLMTVVNNVQLKKLEEITFTHDERALFIVDNTFSVLGASFSKRKLY